MTLWGAHSIQILRVLFEKIAQTGMRTLLNIRTQCNAADTVLISM